MIKLRRLLRWLRRFSVVDLLVVGIPLLGLVVAGFWYASRYINPAPPDQIVLASGPTGGGYQRFSAFYKDVLGRYGIDVIERNSAGSIENIALLRDEEAGVDVAFMQGGVARVREDDNLYTLGGLYFEPLWIFYRADIALQPLDRITQLQGRRIAIGPPGSGARSLAMDLLAANQIDADNASLLDIGGLDLAAAFAAKSIDVGLVVGEPQSAAVWLLLHTPGLRLMSLAHAEAYSRRFPYLTHLVLPRGGIDIADDLPAANVELVAPTASLMVRDDIHPALVDLLMQAMVEAHGEAGAFQRKGEFPRPVSDEFALSPQAERYYKSGRPWLQRFLPFWAATLIDRMVVLLIPLIAVLIPVLRFAPGIYNWRVKSHIYRRYGELKLLEAELESEPLQHSRQEWLRRLDAIEEDVSRLALPLIFTDMLYNLRFHIGLVRSHIDKHPDAPPPSG